MARILIAEPNEALRTLYSAVVSELGHDAVSCAEADSASPDVTLVEPAAPDCFALALRLRFRHPGRPIICASIYEPWPGSSVLRPLAYLIKPFSLIQLTTALEEALART